MPSQANNQFRTLSHRGTIQIIEDLVDRVLRKNLNFRSRHVTAVPAPPTLRLVMDDFPELQEIIKAAA